MRLQEREQQLGIGDVQLRLTPLEEVFMAVARQAEVQHAQQAKANTQLVMEDGTTLQVSNCIQNVKSWLKCHDIQHCHMLALSDNDVDSLNEPVRTDKTATGCIRLK